MPLSPPLVSSVLRTSVSFLVGVLLFGAVTLPSQAQERKTLDRIAAVVGDEIILTSEVDQMVKRQTRRGQASYSDDLWMEMLQNLVDQKLLAEKARRDTNITISDQQVSDRLSRQIEQWITRAGSKDALEKAYGKSVPEIKEDLQGDFKTQLLAERLRRKRQQKIDITPSEVRQWFEDIPADSLPELPKTARLSHIVRYPKPTESAKKEARQLIESIRDSVVNEGASFEQMARQFSDDERTASNGGTLSGINLNELVPEFSAVVSQTPEGQISQVFYNESQQGFHILRVNSRSGNTVDLNHILIKVNPEESTAEKVKSFLSTVRDSILNHDQPFELMARRHSEEDRSSENGGRVTDPKRGSRDLILDALGPSWRRSIQQLDEGEISRPKKVKLLNDDEAYHIVRLDRVTPAHRASLETDYERIRKLALQAKRERRLKEWIDTLRDEFYVDIRVSKEDLTASR